MARPEGGYFTPDGIRIVSVTEALNGSRVRRWGGRREAWARRATIGSAVHQVAAILDVNGLTWDTAPGDWLDPYASVSPEVEGFIRSWELCKRTHQIRLAGCPGIPLGGLVEHTLFAKSGCTDFATTIDRAGLIFKSGVPAIIELKTPRVQECYWGVQLSGQLEALVQSFGPPVRRPFYYERWVAQLFVSGRCAKLIPFTDPRDRDVFLWALNLVVWQQEKYGILDRE